MINGEENDKTFNKEKNKEDINNNYKTIDNPDIRKIYKERYKEKHKDNYEENQERNDEFFDKIKKKKKYKEKKENQDNIDNDDEDNNNDNDDNSKKIYGTNKFKNRRLERIKNLEKEKKKE